MVYPRGTGLDEKGVAKGGDRRSLIIELKHYPVRPFENDGVTVWSYRWNPGEPSWSTRRHRPDVDDARRQETVNEYKAFDIRFKTRDARIRNCWIGGREAR